jgi:hypothetical protein
MLTPPTQEELRKLKSVAEAATPGPWVRLFGERTVYDRMEDGCRGNSIVRADCAYSGTDGANLDFIAAANPKQFLALLALIDAQQKRIDELKVANEGLNV